MAPKSGQSEKEKKTKEAKIHDVQWHLNVNVNHEKKQIGGVLNMPAAIQRYQGVCPPVPVMMDLLVAADSTAHALTIMRDSCGSNILNAKLVCKGESGVLAWVEPYTGKLNNYMKSKKLGISVYTDSQDEFTLPTPNLGSAVSQVINGFEQLNKSGHYHGGFSLDKTYYVMDKDSGALTIKLCNFRKKEGRFSENVAEDWHALKDGLVEISNIAKTLMRQYPRLDCCQLDGLIDVLQNIGPGNANSCFGFIRRQPFFWEKAERKEFFISDIPLALANRGFFSKVKNANFIKLPWGKKFDGLLRVMNAYRLSKEQKAYDTSDKVEYVKFISGAYSHEAEIKEDLHVDFTVQDKDPGLCYKLYALMPNGRTTDT